MAFDVSDVLEFIEEHDIKFIRLSYCNLFGVQKNVAVMAQELAEAFEHGVRIDTASVEGFLNKEHADLLLCPDPKTLSTLPWRPAHGGVARLYCDIRKTDGTPCAGDGRMLLRKVLKKYTACGIDCRISSKCEFYLFSLDENGEATRRPLDKAGYCDIAPRDKGENIRREICLSLEDMGIQPQTSHHERGPGQNEIVLGFRDALEAVDALVSMRAVTEIIAGRNGLAASFNPKPLPEHNGSGLHLDFSLRRGGENIFRSGWEHTPDAAGFLAGILANLGDFSAFLNPRPESYLRVGNDVPATVSWSHQNRNLGIQIPVAAQGHPCMELRTPDMALSPYLGIALLLEAGLSGMEQGLVPTGELETAGNLPASLQEAVERAKANKVVRGLIPPEALEAYCAQTGARYTRFTEKNA